jgi:pectinesterase
VTLLGAAGALIATPATAAGSPVATLRVAKDDTGITTIEAALAAAAALATPVTIVIAPGVYREKLHVTVPHVTLAAAAPGVTIVYGAAAGHVAPDGKPWGTGRSATVTVEAADVTLRGLTIANDFDYVADTISHASNGAQAVALSLTRTADRVLVDRCAIEGYQDTLYVNARSRFRRCRIVGGVDFIFGGAAALFDACTIVTRCVPGALESGFVAAPSTLADQRFGLVFDRCHLTREAGVPDGSAWLGRPWRAGGNMAILGSAIFLRCRMDAHIKAPGWTAMGFTDPAGVRRMLEPEQARLFEWRSTGPGAAPAGPTRRRLTDGEAAAFTPTAILQGWAS